MFYFIGGIIFWYCIIFVYKTKTGSPSVMSRQKEQEQLGKYIKAGMRVADMGCGDAGAVMAMVRAGAERGEGWEIEPLFWLLAQWKVRRAGMGRKIKIHFGDMWGAKLNGYDLIYVYQLTRFAKRMAAKIKREARPGTIIIANTYPLSGLRECGRDGKLIRYQI